jgi:hypothetical protein
VDINQLGPTQANDMNKQAHKFGLMGNDFYSMLTKDVEEQEALRAAREQEEEKALYSVNIYIDLSEAVTHDFNRVANLDVRDALLGKND